VATDNCDYSDADDFDGWGFDPVSMTSCPPLANDNSGSNVVATDTDSDGATTDAADELSDDSTGNSNAETTVENENNTDETVVSNTQDGISIGQESSDETASPSSGGGSFWLPILMFAVAFRRSVLVVEDLYVFPK